MVEKKKTQTSMSITTTTTQQPMSMVERNVQDYFATKLKDKKVSDEDKRMFLMTCIANNLNPFKGEIYPLTFRDSKTGFDTLTPVIDYKFYIQRAEESGMLNGWKTEIIKEGNKVKGGKITIHRKGRSNPFELELGFDDACKKYNDGNPMGLRASSPVFMMRKQLIREGFKLCFPGTVKDVEELQENEVIEQEPVRLPNDLPEAISYMMTFLPKDKLEDLEKFSEGKSDKEIVEALKITLLTISSEIGLSDEDYEKIKNI